MMSEERFYVYGLFEPADGGLDVCFYIGKGCGRRMYEHFKDSFDHYNLHKKHKIEKLRRNNKTPYARKIFSELEEEKAYKLEEQLIEELGLDNLTNLREGGFGFRSGDEHPLSEGYSHSEETKRKIGNAHRDKTISKESIRKMSESHKGKNIPKETKRKMSDSTIGESNPMYGKKRGNHPAHGRQHTEEELEKMSKAHRGENNPQSKLSNREASEIKWLCKNTKKNHSKIAEYYNISSTSVSNIKNEKSWANAKPIKPKRYNE